MPNSWSARDWDNVLAVYPYNVQPDSQLNATLASATGTSLPYVRADWFASEISAECNKWAGDAGSSMSM